MATYDYGHLQSVAQRLINKYGRAATLVKRDETPSDASKPWRTNDGSGDIEYAVTAVVHPIEYEDTDETLTRRGDQRAYVGSETDLGENLSDFDRLRDPGGTEWKIVKADPLNPGGTILLYTFELVR